MTWEMFYLLVFLVGLGLALGSFVLGAHHGADGSSLGGHHGGDLGSLTHGGDLGHGAANHSGSVPHTADQSGESVSPFNIMTISAFLIWFGGAGYILTSVYAWLAILALGVSVLSGFIGGFVVFMFLVKVLFTGQTSMNPDDFKLIGTVGELSIGIHEAGTGEVVYVHGGTRKSLGAKNRRGIAIPQGTEVVVLDYEDGIAYVEPVDEYVRS